MAVLMTGNGHHCFIYGAKVNVEGEGCKWAIGEQIKRLIPFWCSEKTQCLNQGVPNSILDSHFSYRAPRGIFARECLTWHFRVSWVHPKNNQFGKLTALNHRVSELAFRPLKPFPSFRTQNQPPLPISEPLNKRGKPNNKIQLLA